MPYEEKYYVLKLRAKHRNDHLASASQAAVRMFAVSIEPYDQELAKHLLDWVKREEKRQQGLPSRKLTKAEKAEGNR